MSQVVDIVTVLIEGVDPSLNQVPIQKLVGRLATPNAGIV